jgi:hypothetical protein
MVLALLLGMLFLDFERMHYEPLVTIICLPLLAEAAAVIRFDLGFLCALMATASLAFSHLVRPSFRNLRPHFSVLPA